MTLGELRDEVDGLIRQNSPHCPTDVNEITRDSLNGLPRFRFTQSSIAMETMAGKLRSENYRMAVKIEELEKALREEKNRTVAASISLPL